MGILNQYTSKRNLQPLQYIAIAIMVMHTGSLLFYAIFFSSVEKDFGGTLAVQEVSENRETQTAQVILNNFRRSEFKDGIKKWNIDAKTARYLSNKNVLLLDSPVVSIARSKDEPPTVVNSKAARLSMSEGNIKTALLEGDVRIELSPDLILRSSVAEYIQDESRLVTPERVTIKGKGYNISGDRMDLLIERAIVNLYDNIESDFDPGTRKPKLNKIRN